MEYTINNAYYTHDYVYLQPSARYCGICIQTPYSDRFIDTFSGYCGGLDIDVSCHVKYTNLMQINILKEKVFNAIVENVGCYECMKTPTAEGAPTPAVIGIYLCQPYEYVCVYNVYEQCVGVDDYLQVSPIATKDPALILDYCFSLTTTGVNYNPFKVKFWELPQMLSLRDLDDIACNTMITYYCKGSNGNFSIMCSACILCNAQLDYIYPEYPECANIYYLYQPKKVLYPAYIPYLYTMKDNTYSAAYGISSHSPFNADDYKVRFEEPCKYKGTIIAYLTNNQLAYIPITSITNISINTSGCVFNSLSWNDSLYMRLGGYGNLTLKDGRSMNCICSQERPQDAAYGTVDNTLTYTADTYVMDSKEAQNVVKYGFPNILDALYLDFATCQIKRVTFTSKPDYSEYKGLASFNLKFKLW